jgi:hypothetical protein
MDQYLCERPYGNHHTTDYKFFFKHFLPRSTYLVSLLAISGGHYVPPPFPSVTVLIYGTSNALHNKHREYDK